MTATQQAQQAQRAVRGREFVAAFTFGLDGDSLPDADTTVSVTVTNAEGTVVVGPVAATLTGAVATYKLTAAQLPERDFLTVSWSATVDTATEVQLSTIDVCDARLFPLGDYVQYPEIAANGYSDAKLEQARIDAEDRLEWECGCAFTGRYGTEEHLLASRHGFADGVWAGSWAWDRYEARGVNHLALRRPFVQKLRSITRAWIDPDDDTSGTHALNLNYARLDSHRSVVHVRHDPTDQYGGLYGDLTIDYEHGQPVADVRRICLILARYRLLHGPLDQRATQAPVEGGGTINLATPGIQGSRFGIPEVDSFCDRHDHRALGFLGGSR